MIYLVTEHLNLSNKTKFLFNSSYSRGYEGRVPKCVRGPAVSMIHAECEQASRVSAYAMIHAGCEQASRLIAHAMIHAECEQASRVTGSCSIISQSLRETCEFSRSLYRIILVTQFVTHFVTHF